MLEVDKIAVIRWMSEGAGNFLDGEEVGKSWKEEENEMEKVVRGKVQCQQSWLPFLEGSRSERKRRSPTCPNTTCISEKGKNNNGSL